MNVDRQECNLKPDRLVKACMLASVRLRKSQKCIILIIDEILLQHFHVYIQGNGIRKFPCVLTEIMVECHFQLFTGSNA